MSMWVKVNVIQIRVYVQTSKKIWNIDHDDPLLDELKNSLAVSEMNGKCLYR